MTSPATPSPQAQRNWLFWLGLIVLFFVFIYLIRSVLLPFVLGIFIAYFLDPAADRLQRSKFSRGTATVFIIGAFFVMLGLISVLIVPVLFNQLTALFAALPEFVTTMNNKYSPIITQWLGDMPILPMSSIHSAVSDASGVMVKAAGSFATSLFMSGMVIVNVLSLILITPIVAFYLLRDWDKLVAKIDNLLPRDHAPVIRKQVRIIDRTLAGFVRGQVNVCLIVGSFYAIALSAAGLNFGILIGLATGILFALPYVGFGIGMAIGMGVAIFQFGTLTDVGIIFAIYMAGQLVESNFLTPKLVGESVGLHPVWIIFGMLAGATLFGFVGVLLSVPATAVLGVLIRFAISRYLESRYYKGHSARTRK